MYLSDTGVYGRIIHGLFSAFLVVTSVIAALAAITVLYPHGFLVAIWSVKQAEYQQLLNVRFLAGGGLALLSAVLALTTVGWVQHRRWAWFLFSIILAINLVSDIARAIVTRQWFDLLGALLEGLILFWLTSRPIRNQFYGRTNVLDEDKRNS